VHGNTRKLTILSTFGVVFTIISLKLVGFSTDYCTSHNTTHPTPNNYVETYVGFEFGTYLRRSRTWTGNYGECSCEQLFS